MEGEETIGVLQTAQRVPEALFKTIRYNPVRWIIWGNADLDPISDHHFDTVLLHPAGEDGADLDVVFTVDLFEPTPKRLGNGPLELN
jgi:hypothetical protein